MTTPRGGEDSALFAPDNSAPVDVYSYDSGPPDPKSETADAQGPAPIDAGAPDVAAPQDVAGPQDVPAPPDAGPPPLDNGQTDPGGFLNGDISQDCEALDLPVSWSGTFDGDITSTWGNVSVEGTMAFEIGCLGAKLVVWGDMSGFGEGQPFTLKIQGAYNPATKTIKAKLVEGEVKLFFFLPIAFEGDLEGEYDGVKFNGEWSGTNTDKTVLDASGDGTWEASGQ